MSDGSEHGAHRFRSVPYASHPFTDAPWDAAAAEKRMQRWAGVDVADPPESAWKKYSEGFAKVDGDGDKLGDFHYPHHDVQDGKLVTNIHGVEAGIAAANGARSGQKDSEPLAHLEEHKRAWDKEHGEKREAAADDFPLLLDEIGVDKYRLTGIRLTGTKFEDQASETYSWIQLARVGKYKGHPAGPFEFTPKVFDQLKANFQKSENGEVPLDFEHATELMEGTIPQDGAPATGWIQQLDNRGADGLFGLVKWLEPGLGYVRSERYKFFSPAVQFEAIDARTGEKIGPLLTSGAMTNRPFLDGMQRLAASGRAAEQQRATAQKAMTMATTNMDADGVGKSTGTPPGDTQPEPKYLKFAMAAGMDDHHASEEKVLEHLKKMAKEHKEMSARLSALENEKKETEAKRAKAEVGKLVKLGVIKTEAQIAGVLKMRAATPDVFETLYREALDAGDTVQETSLRTMSAEEAEAKILMREFAPNRGNAPHHMGGMSQPGIDALEPSDDLVAKLMKDNPALSYTEATVAASGALKTQMMNGRH